MQTAKAIRIRAPGDADVLDVVESRVRDPGPDEVLVDVAAAGLNRADLLQRRGLYAAPEGVVQDVPGLEYAGTVLSVGEDVRAFQAGDRVMGIVAGGAMATRLVVHEREMLRVPEGLALEEAAAIPEAFMTAWDALFLQARLRLGENVLLHAVSSGVGTAALQLALAAGAHTLGTSRTQNKLDRCLAMGLAAGIVVEQGKFAERGAQLTGGRGADVVVDTVGAA